MNMLTQLSEAFTTVNDMDRESHSILGFFGPEVGTTAPRSAPASSVYMRRRERARRAR